MCHCCARSASRSVYRTDAPEGRVVALAPSSYSRRQVPLDNSPVFGGHSNSDEHNLDLWPCVLGTGVTQHCFLLELGAAILCCNTVLQYGAVIRCSNTVQHDCAAIRCCNTVLQYGAIILCSMTVLQYGAVTLCSVTVSLKDWHNWSPTLSGHLFSHPVQIR